MILLTQGPIPEILVKTCWELVVIEKLSFLIRLFLLYQHFDLNQSQINGVACSVDILLDSTHSIEILKISTKSSQVKFTNGYHSTRSSFYGFVSSKFLVLGRVFLKEHCNFYASTENVLPYCVQHNCCAWIWSPSKKVNPELVIDDYKRLKIIRKTKIDKSNWGQYYSKKERKNNKKQEFFPAFYSCHFVSIYISVRSWIWVLQSPIL